ncbi:hypothetical protein EYF80_022922 [Liparis tanakae]|uniref:Uncharacterized protein n=1 Tax=Liparis tanakae TaxID=230148 RepID=A0A4Z2HPE3_9TELE|nr:hypothetical protein EYF80_022922 [Liparis tanakae]
MGKGRAAPSPVAPIAKAAPVLRAQDSVVRVLVDVATWITSISAMTSSVWGALSWVTSSWIAPSWESWSDSLIGRNIRVNQKERQTQQICYSQLHLLHRRTDPGKETKREQI